jgi:hypothetical protein
MDSQERTGGKRLSGKDILERIARKIEPGQDSPPGQKPGLDCHDRLP